MELDGAYVLAMLPKDWMWPWHLAWRTFERARDTKDQRLISAP